MKLAIIDHRCDESVEGIRRLSIMRESYTKRKTHVNISNSLQSFEKEYKTLDKYDGAILHPGIKDQKMCLSIIKNKYPNLNFVIAANFPPDYGFNGNVFLSDEYDKILKYFLENTKKE